MDRLEVEFLTTDRCPGSGCSTCGRAERALRAVSSIVGVPIPVVAPTQPVAAGIGAAVTVVIRHLDCDEAEAELAGVDPPAARFNGHLVLHGPDWGEKELQDAFLEWVRRVRVPKV